MKCYKLTDENGQTQNKTQWGENVSNSASGESGQPLCSNGWIHFYTNPFLAVLMNPVHANFKSPRLWEAESSGEELHELLKSGSKTLTTIKEIPLPEISLIQKVAFSILCGKEVYKDKDWTAWADKWLSGEDRTTESAEVANAAAYAAAHAAAHASYYAAYYAYYAATHCANAAATHCANAADAAYYAADANKNINFVKIVEKSMKY
jgi:hypothetical protein